LIAKKYFRYYNIFMDLERHSGEAAREAAIERIMNTQGLSQSDAERIVGPGVDTDNQTGHEVAAEIRSGAVLLGSRAVGGDILTPSDWGGPKGGPRTGEEEHTGYGPEGRYPQYTPPSDEQEAVYRRGRAKVGPVLDEINARIAAKKRRS